MRETRGNGGMNIMRGMRAACPACKMKETSRLVKGVRKWSEHRSEAANGFYEENNAGKQLFRAQNCPEIPETETCGVCGPHGPRRAACPNVD